MEEIKQKRKENEKENGKEKRKCQTKLTIPSLWHFIMRYLNVQDHITAACVCTEWFVYGSNEASWITTLNLTVKKQYYYARLNSYSEYKKLAIYETPKFTMGMFSHHTQIVRFSHEYQLGVTNPLMQIIFNEICDKCTQLKSINMNKPTLQLNNESFKQLCRLKNLEKFVWDNMEYYDLADHLSPITSLTRLKEIPHILMEFVLLPHNLKYCDQLRLESISLISGTSDTTVARMNDATLFSNLVHLKGAHDTLTRLNIGCIRLKNFNFNVMAPFHNLTTLRMTMCVDLPYQFIRDICTSGLKLTTLVFDGFSLEEKKKNDKDDKDNKENPFDQLHRLTSLTDLQLCGGQHVNDFRIANQITHLKKLARISLTDADITNKTFTAIGSLPDMERIDISMTQIQFSDLDNFIMLPKLNYLNAAFCGLPENSEEMFQKKRLDNNLPTIHWRRFIEPL